MMDKNERIHRHLSRRTYETKRILENEYHRFDKKVRIDIIITYLAVMMLCGCLCGTHAIEKQPTKDATTLKTTTTLKTEVKTVINEVNDTRIIYKIQTINETYYEVEKKYYDLTVTQLKELKNLIPRNRAGSAAYSGGFFECKEHVLDLLNIEKSRFSEAAGSDFQPFYQVPINQSLITLQLKYDNYTKYFELPSDYWYVAVNRNTSNLSIPIKIRRTGGGLPVSTT